MARVITYVEPRYATSKLDSGECVMLSIARTGIVIYRMMLGGLLPRKKLAEWPPARLTSFTMAMGEAGAYDDPNKNAFRGAVDALCRFPSISDLVAHFGQYS